MIKMYQKKWFIYVAGVFFFLTLVRYKGFDSDAALYLLQVVNYLHPERFVNDVPFMFGNQDSFSIFSPIIAQVYKIIGVNAGGFATTLAMLIAWASCAITFVIKWADRFGLARWILFIIPVYFVLLLNKDYGSGVFYLPMMESYLVARVFSEIFVLAGLACLFDKNKSFSLFLFIIAFLFHPLMGGWALPLWLFFYYPRTCVPIVILSLFAPLSGFVHIGRLDFYPADWRPLYYTPGLGEFCSFSGLLLFWFFMYRKIGEQILSRFSLSLFWVSLIGFYLQFAGCFSAHLLLYQAQPFRVQWLCTISAIPIFFIYVNKTLVKEKKLYFDDYAGLLLGVCAIAGQFWVLVPYVAIAIVLRCLRLNFKVSQTWINLLFAISFTILFTSSALENFVQLSLEQGVGDAFRAIALLNIPAKIDYIIYILLSLLFLISAKQGRLGIALAFAISFCNTDLKILPITAILFYLVPQISSAIKYVLITLTSTVSFAELLASLDEVNSIQVGPLQGNSIKSITLLVIVFILSFLLIKSFAESRKRIFVASLMLLILLLGWWNVCKWDARADGQVACEQQMDSFFEKPLFPQVANRGKILFAVENESPIQSRINFLTGAYADESIFVGEVFYKEQYIESNRRRSALLRGDTILADMTSFKINIHNVYQNPDTLLSRVAFLCQRGEITHFVTESNRYPLFKQDSAFLEKRDFFVYLYSCPSP